MQLFRIVVIDVMALQHEQWIVDAFAGLSDKDIGVLHKLLGKVKDHATLQAAARAEISRAEPVA